MEGGTAAKVDDVFTALDYAYFNFLPVFFGDLFSADDFGKGFAVDRGGRSINRHLLAMAAICAAVDDFVGGDVQVFGKLAAQTRAVECGQCGYL